MSRIMDRWNALFDEVGSVRALRLIRIVAGPVVILHLMPFVQDMRRGIYYGDFFYAPWVSWFPEAPRALYFGMLGACLVTAALMSLGVLSRLTTTYTFAFVAYNFFLSETHFRHNRNFLLIVLAGLMLVEATGSGRIRPAWPIWLLRFEASCVYLGSGVSKLVDPDWWSGLVTWDRVLRFQGAVEASPAPRWLIDLVTNRTFHDAFAKFNILTEIFIGIGLWFPRTRLLAAWMAVGFHVMIEISARVQVFSWLAIAALLIWAVPRERERVLELPAGARVLAWMVRWLDWLARFQTVSSPTGSRIRVTDRDGTVIEGKRAVLFVLTRLPALFFFVAPVHALVSAIRGRAP